MAKFSIQRCFESLSVLSLKHLAADRSTGKLLVVVMVCSGSLALLLAVSNQFKLLSFKTTSQSPVLAVEGSAGDDPLPLFPGAPGDSNQLSGFDRERILNDYDNRISDRFAIAEGLRDRVGFWFDVYTKYDSNRRVIHHTRYPWIIYKVVDVTDIILSKSPKRRWMRNNKADQHVKREMARVRAALRSVAKRRSLKDLDSYEALVVDALRKLGGNVRKEARRAIGEVRVQTGQKDFFIEGLTISPRYLGTMEEIFREHNLPVELTRIPFVESSFNKHAISKVGASGIWQFMGNTGRKFMIVNERIDERRSPFKSTEAAARLLKENHLILYRSWPLAVTAWNHGPGGLRKASQAVGSKDLARIIKNYRSKRFDFASANFYSEFLAALHAQMYQMEVYGPIEKEMELNLEVVRLKRPTKVKNIVRVSGLSIEEFLSINPELKKAASINMTLPKGFRFHVPNEARQDIERHLAMNVYRSKDPAAVF